MLKLLAKVMFVAILCCGAMRVWAAEPEKVGNDLSEHQVLVMLHMPAPHFRPDGSYGGRYGDDSSKAARKRIADQLAHEYGLVLVDDWPIPIIGIDCFVMEDRGGASAPHLVDMLSHDARIEWVQPMGNFHSLGQSDPLYETQPAAKFWHLRDLHRITTGRHVLIAVVDSGVAEDHPDLQGQVTVRENFVVGEPYVAEQHGTAVAGIIAALAGNGIGIEGIAPSAQLMALRACWQPHTQAQCNSFTLSKAINFAITHGARVINLSLGGPPDRLLQNLLEFALRNGITVVAAVDPNSGDGGFPADMPGVLAVASMDSSHEKAESTKTGAISPLHAPGQDIPTTVPGGRWNYVSGSSYAAAHISGLVALMTELQPSLNPAQLRAKVVVAHAGSSGERDVDEVDACATIGYISGGCACQCPTIPASTTIKNH